MEYCKRLLSLIRRGKFQRVKSELEVLDLSESLDTIGVILLRYSAKHGNVKVTRYLLKKGCNIDSQSSQGSTALMRALAGNHVKVMKLLLRAGASASLLDHENGSALKMVGVGLGVSMKLEKVFMRSFRKTCSSSEEVAAKLIEADCNFPRAVYTKDAKVIEIMLEQGASVHSEYRNIDVKALHIAAGEDIEVAKVLLKHGADANAIDYAGRSPAHYIFDDVEMLELLMNHGIDLSSCNPIDGLFQIRTLLMYGDVKIIRFVLSHFDFETLDEKGRGILHYLAMNSMDDVDEVVKEHLDKCDVKALDDDGLNPLHIAAIQGSSSMVKLLLNHGAEINYAESLHNRTALYYAYARTSDNREFGWIKTGSRYNWWYDECVEILLQRGADPQLIANGQHGKKLTIFEAALKIEGCVVHKRMKSVTAQLALLEALGTPIDDIIRSKINTYSRLKRYYRKCRRVLKENIGGSVTLLKLLRATEKNLEKFVGNGDIVLKLSRLENLPRIRSSFRYYYNTLKERVTTAIKRRRISDEAARAICDIFGSLHINQTHVAVRKVNKYLKEEDHQQLSKV